MDNHETIILSSLTNSLEEGGVDPVTVLGAEVKGLTKQNNEEKIKLSEDEIISIQEKIIINLMEQISNADSS